MAATTTNGDARLVAPRTEDGRPLLLAGVRERYTAFTCRNIPAQWERLGPRIDDIPGRVGGRIAYGVCLGMLTDRDDTFEYLSGVEVRETPSPAGEWSYLAIPAQRYVVFPHQGHVSKLSHTIDAACEWLPRAGFRTPASAAGLLAFFERYGEGFDPRTGMGAVEVWFPIREEK